MEKSHPKTTGIYGPDYIGIYGPDYIGIFDKKTTGKRSRYPRLSLPKVFGTGGDIVLHVFRWWAFMALSAEKASKKVFLAAALCY